MEGNAEIKETIAFCEKNEEIINCWKSASKMRPWLQERKNQRSDKWTSRFMSQATLKKKETITKMEEEKEKAKEEGEKKEDGGEKQIDSSAPKDESTEKKEDEGEKKEAAEDDEAKNFHLTEDEKSKVNDDAFDKA